MISNSEKKPTNDIESLAFLVSHSLLRKFENYHSVWKYRQTTLLFNSSDVLGPEMYPRSGVSVEVSYKFLAINWVEGHCTISTVPFIVRAGRCRKSHRVRLRAMDSAFLRFWTLQNTHTHTHPRTQTHTHTHTGTVNLKQNIKDFDSKVSHTIY